MVISALTKRNQYKWVCLKVNTILKEVPVMGESVVDRTFTDILLKPKSLVGGQLNFRSLSDWLDD